MIKGWKIEEKINKPFRYMHIRAPNGYTAVVSELDRNPSNVLFMLCEALLEQDKPPVPKCACCGTTENLYADHGSGGPWRCDSADCMVF